MNSLFKSRLLIWRFSMPEMDSVEAGDAIETKETKQQPETVDKPDEDSAEYKKERESLISRHREVGEKIHKAKLKYHNCLSLTKKLPEGSDPKIKAEKSCEDAKKCLQRIKRIFPKKDTLASSPTTAIEESSKQPSKPLDIASFEKALTRSSHRTDKLIRTLNTTKKNIAGAKEAQDSLRGMGLDDKIIVSLFKLDQGNPGTLNGVMNIMKTMADNAEPASFKKMIPWINQVGFTQFASKLIALKPAKLSAAEATEALTVDCVLSGKLATNNLVKYLKDLKASNTDFAEGINRLKLLSSNSAFIKDIDWQQNLSTEIARITYFEKVQIQMGFIGLNPDTSSLRDLYRKEPDADKVLLYFSTVQHLSTDFGDLKELFFLEPDPEKAKEVYADLKSKAESEQKNVQELMNEKEKEAFLEKYPNLNRYNLDKFRLLDEKPGLYPFMQLQTFKLGDSSPSIAEYRSFSNDPSLSVAIAIYRKRGGRDTGKLTMGYPQIEECLKLGRTLFYNGVDASGVTELDVETEIEKINRTTEASSKLELYSYIDENGENRKREIVFVAGNNGEIAPGTVQKNTFHSDDINRGLIASGAEIDASNVYAAEDFNDFNTNTPEAKREKLRALKTAILTRLRTAKPPMTMCFNGHGSEKGLHLADLTKTEDGQHINDPDGYISAKEIADAILDRSRKFSGNNNLSKDIYMFAACQTPAVTMEILSRVKVGGGVIPTIGGAGEYGFTVVASDSQANRAFQLDKPNAKIGNLMMADNKSNQGTDMYLYAPDTDGNPVQII
ncbi:MAG: hypothetical protein O3B47_02330 [bacterium]|nr:hypothetical protein [bacterium]